MSWYNTNWHCRKSHVIQSASGAGTDYQIKIHVHYGAQVNDNGDNGEDVYLNGFCKPDFGDIRFTKSDGTTLLPYWMESKADAKEAIFWVKIADDLSTTNRTIYIYYNNLDVTTTSSFDDTFIFGDPFDNATLNTNRWPSVDGNPSYTINAEEHYLEVTNMDANNWWTGKGFHSRTNIAFPSSYIVEDAYSSSGALIMHKSDVASEIFGALFIIDDSSWDGNNVGVAHGNIQDNWAADAYYYKGAGVGENADWYSGEIAGAVGTWYSLQTRIWKLAGNIKVDTDGTVRVDEANTQTPNRVHLGINRYSTYGFGTERFYAFKIRKYVSPEPQHGAWGSIEINGTITVGNTALVTGYASKNTTITSSANPIIRVLSNFVPYDNTLRSPLIENIVLQGVNGNETAILLDDVYNCQIRNVTIKNCGIGINLRNASHWTEATHIKHVRMTDVTKGIVFERYSGGEEQRSFAFTHIEDVGIALKDAANCIGIEVGPACKPYSSFIKANVWLTNANNNIGLDVKNNGEVKYGLVNLYVANVSGVGSRGIGVNIDTANGGIVEKNQGPLLLTAFRLYRSVLPEGYSNDLIKRVEIT